MKIKFYITIAILLLYICAGCDRSNIYELSSGKSRTAYAVIDSGSQYRIAIVNLNWDKIYNITLPVNGISVNSHTIIIYDTAYTYRAENDLTTWLSIATPPPSSTTILGYNENFVYFASNNLYMLNISTQSWDGITNLTNGVGIFQGHDGEIYAFESSDPDSFYRFTEGNFELTMQFNSNQSFEGGFLGGYRTPRYFYVFYDGTSDSIFRTDGITDINFNDNISLNFIFDVTVTDDDKIYAMISLSGSNLLINLTAPDTYTQLLNCE